jgi:PAB1-binding protein PBP1
MCFFVVNSSASVYEFTSGTKSFDGFLGRSIFARDADRLFFPMKFKMFLNSQAINASKQCKIQASNASLHLARPV